MSNRTLRFPGFIRSSIGRALARVLIPCIVLQGWPVATAFAATHAPAPEGSGGAAAVSVFGPKDYVRELGQPVVVTDTFAVANPGTFALRIDNGGALGQYPRVSSAIVTLNGAVVAAPFEFSQEVGILTKEVTLQAQNTLQVELRSIPGSAITVNIFGAAPGNRAPAADAGHDQTASVGQIVTLDGSHSSDPDGDALHFQWSAVALPPGSGAILSDPSAVQPTFAIDVPGTYEFALIVNDGSLSSVADHVRVTTQNSAPVANAGPDQTALVGQTVTLDGSGSTDPDGDGLTYQWTILSRPSSSNAVLSDPSAVKPTFVVDASGTYDIRLIVHDGVVPGAADTVRVTTENSPPTANAGPDQTKPVGAIVTLDGSASSDVDGDALSYHWSLQSVPPGSLAILVDANTVNPRFTIDVPGSYVAQLIVDDGTATSAPDTVSITTVNSPPVANAGADRTALVGAQITLDGGASSDVDGDSLTFHWSITSKPAGSAATLSDPAAVSPTFVIDAPGAYVVQLVVNDGAVDSAPDTMTVSTLNSAPVANAGADQSGFVGATITLDGSGSSDVDGDALTYAWNFQSKPAGSAATLSDPAAVSPTFVVDVPGTYVAQLIVDDGSVSSPPDTVIITTLNSAPVAKAGADQTAFVGTTVLLDGSGSLDADGNVLTYQWSFVSRPVGSTAALSDPQSPTPTFVVDAAGDYVLQLIVNDATVDSAPDTITVSTLNTRPVAHAGADQTVIAGNTVTLDGSGSADADGDPLAYQWSVLSQPIGSAVTLSDPTAVMPAFVPSLGGVYVFQLIVNDGHEDSAPDSLMVTARVVVPGVVNLTQAAATAAITGAGLVVGAVTTEHSAVVVAGQVISQSPAGGTIADAGDAVDLVVSLGPEPVVVPDVVGMPQAAAQAAIAAATLVVGTVTSENSGSVPAGHVIAQAPAGGTSAPPGSAVDLVISLGPAVPGLQSIIVTPANHTLARGEKQQYIATGVFSDSHTEDLTATVTWESTNGPIASITAAGLAEGLDAGATTIRATKSAIVGSANLTVIAAKLTSIVVAPASPILLTGSTQAFTATGVLSDGTSQNLTTEVMWESTNTAAATIGAGGLAAAVAAGATTIKATKDTVSGSTGLQVQLKEGGTPVPTSAITSPTEGARIIAPVNVVGTANDGNFQRYVLEIAPARTTTFSTIASGTTPIIAGTLGTLDPTTVTNGQYELRLTVFDRSGQSSAASVAVQVDGDLKVGNFSLRFEDLKVPMAGIPITVARLYDSRDKHSGDFGFGWQLDVQTMKPSVARAFGSAWQQTKSGGFFPNYCLVETKSHTVSITLADGRVERFNATTSPQCQQLVPIDFVTIAYVPLSGTLGTLVPLDAVDAIYNGGVPGPGELLDLDTFNVIDPRRFQYTAGNGDVIILNTTTGVESIQDLNGNRTTFTAGGIQHSAGTSVTFTRDALSRITQITDPNGNILRYNYDANGDLISFVDALGNTTRFSYNMSHGLLDIRDPRGLRPIRNEYDNSGRLVRTIDAFGKTVEFQHDVTNRQEVVTDRLGNPTVHLYDTSGNVTRTTDALGGVRNFTYDASGNRLTEVNPLGKTRTYTYDSRANRLTDTDPLGNKTTYTYNARGQVLTITDPLGRVTTNVYDANGNLTKTTDPLNNSTSYTYNARGLQLTITDAMAGVTTFTYDAAGRVTQRTGPLGQVMTFTYDANGNRLSETKTRTVGGTVETLITTFEYDKMSRLTKTTFPDGSTTRSIYNAIGSEIAKIDQLGRQTTFTYDAMGRPTKTTFPDGTTEESIYDAEGRVLTARDRAGRLTHSTYDQLGRELTKTFADDTFTTTEYDAAGRTKKTIDARGNATRYQYDDAGRRTHVTDALNQTTVFAYDKVGNQISMTDANTNVTSYEYDARNRRTVINYADGTETETTYDALDRIVSKRDQAAGVTQFEYDALGRLVKVIDALNQHTSYGYDELGNRISQTDANSHVTRFEYDALGRRTKRILPLGQAETLTYDAAGNLTSRTDFNGKTTSYAYDAVNRLTSKTPDPSLGEPAVTFAYLATGKRERMVDASGTTTYTYDLLDRLISKATPQGTLTYSYDAAGNLVSLQSSNAGGASTDYTYDALNRLSTVVDNSLAAGTTTYSYDAVGNLASSLYPNGVRHQHTYNTVNRLTNLNVMSGALTLAGYTQALTPAGHKSSITEANGRSVTYTYDALYRLTGEAIAGAPVAGAIGYVYDKVGNRLQRTSTVAPVPAAADVYDDNDRSVSDTYDSNGNTLLSGPKTFAYDFENHMTRANNGAVIFVYDGDGNRVAKTVGGMTTRFLVDDRNPTGYSQVIEEIAGGSVQRTYTYGLNLVSQTQASGTSFYAYDGHGSVRLLTDSAGSITDTYDYDAFGNLIASTGSTSNAYRYGGQRFDSDIGLYYLRARYYEPSLGRFTTMDAVDGQLHDPMSLHKYLYAQANPIAYHDPTGHFAASVATVNVGLAMMQALLATLAILAVVAILSKVKFELPVRLNHYTTWEGLGMILLSGAIASPSGTTYYTPDWYFSSTSAKSSLALPREPDLFININLYIYRDELTPWPPETVKPRFGEDGGGRETSTSHRISLWTRSWGIVPLF